MAIVAAVLFLVAAFGCFARIVFTAGSATVAMMSLQSFAIPGEATVDINEPGVYAIFEETGSRSLRGPVQVTRNGFTRLDPDDVTVTGPDGTRIATMPVSGSETLTRDETIFTASVEFRAPSVGTYKIDVAGAGRSTAVVGRELADQFSPLLPWLLAMFVCGGGFLIASIAVIISAVRASRANRTLNPPGWAPPRTPPPGPPPPGAAPPWPGTASPPTQRLQ